MTEPAMTYREIAKELGVNYQTVQRIEARALEKVKAQLEQRGYGESFSSEWLSRREHRDFCRVGK